MVKGFLKFTEKTLIYQMVTLFLFFCFPFLTFSLCGFGGRYIFNFILYVVLFFLLVYLFIILLVIYIYEYHGQSTQAILNKENDNYHRTLALVP